MQNRQKRSAASRFAALCLILMLLCAGVPASAATVATVTASSVNVYSTPYLTGTVVGTLKKGASVTVSATSGSVAKIVIKGTNYYCSTSGLSTGSSSGTSSTSSSKKMVTTTDLVVYKKASKTSGSYGTVRAGTTVTVLAISGSWAAITVGSTNGYCAAGGLKSVTASATPAPTKASTGYTVNGACTARTNTTVKMYTTPSTSASAYGSFKAGVELKVTAVSGAWAKVSYSGKTGYIERAKLDPAASATPTPASGTYSVNGAGTCVVTAETKLYKSTSTSAAAYGTFKAGAEVKVTAVSGEWAKVSYSGYTGYVPRKLLQPVTAPIAQTKSSDGTYIALGKASLYSKPDLSSNKVAVLAKGDKIKVTAVSGGWLKAVYGGKTCYARDSEFIESVSSVKGLVIVNGMKVYESASTKANVYGTVAEGTLVDVYSVSGSWARVVINNKKGYVPVSNLASGNVNYAILQNGSSGTAVLTLQNRLEKLGYLDGVPSGSYGTVTVNAVKSFQATQGLLVTGIANNATQAALYSSDAPSSLMLTYSLAPGASGAAVSRMQTRLLYKNYYSAGVDGDYGANTTAAVKEFQKTAGLPQTGTADNATIRALYSPDAPAGKPPTPEGSHGTPSLDPPNCVSDNEDIETVIRYALAQRGKPYVYGTSGPNSFDCSGLTYFCFKKVGITMPRSAYDVGYSSSLGGRIAYEDLKRGDVVCFNTIADSDLSDHVGIYLGEGLFIHAPHTGTDVSIVSMTSGYYKTNFSWARRPIK